MTALAQTTARGEERRAAAVAGGAHALHDGYTDLIYIMLPIWQVEFGLTYAALGLLRGMFAGTMAAFQIPSGLLSERLGVGSVLALGTALAGLGYCLAGASAATLRCWWRSSSAGLAPARSIRSARPSSRAHSPGRAR